MALDVLGRLKHLFPEDLLIKFSYGLSLAYMNEREEAGSIFNQIAQEQPGGFFAGMSLALKYAIAGKRSETLRSLDSNPQLMKTRDYQYAYWITECYALIDEKERALDPFLANIRGEERFKKLMERVKYEWEHFEE